MAASTGKSVRLEFHLPGLDLAQVEHVVEQVEQVPPRTEDVAQVVLLPLVELAEHPLEQHLGEADDRVERCAQFVRHAREELGLVPTRLGQLGALHLELPVDTGVGQRDGRLVREGLEQVTRLVAEAPGVLRRTTSAPTIFSDRMSGTATTERHPAAYRMERCGSRLSRRQVLHLERVRARGRPVR